MPIDFPSAHFDFVPSLPNGKIRKDIDLRSARMTAENFDQILTGLQQRMPFQVFTVELHGGRRFEVDHAGAMVVRDGVAVFIEPGGIPIWFDHDSVNQIIGAGSNSAI
jgi:hypothetical protein